jgi:hypothetical protein
LVWELLLLVATAAAVEEAIPGVTGVSHRDDQHKWLPLLVEVFAC